MAAINWAADVNGAFGDAADWQGGGVPGASDDALLEASGGNAFTVTSAAAATVSSIQLETAVGGKFEAIAATLAITGGDFTAANGSGTGVNYGAIAVGSGGTFTLGGVLAQGVVAADSPGWGTLSAESGATIQLQGGTISGGVLNLAAGGALTADSGASAIVGPEGGNGGSILVVNPSSIAGNAISLTLDKALKNSGAIALSTKGGTTDLIVGPHNLSLDGGGTVSLGGAGTAIVGGSGVKLTNDDNTVLGAGEVGGGNVVLTNEAKGVIDATGNMQVFLGAGSVNGGLIEATSGGALTLQQTSLVDETVGGQTGAITAASGSTVVINGSTITDGNLTAVGSGRFATGALGAVLEGAAAGTLSATPVVTLGGEFDVLSGTLGLEGSIANAGTVALSNQLAILQNTTLSGGGVIAMDSAGASQIIAGAAGVTLANVDNTIQGQGTIGSSGLTLDNGANGVIQVGATESLQVGAGGGAVVNAGLMAAAGGTLILEGAIANSGGTVAASAGAVQLDGVTISSGAVTMAAGATVVAAQGASDLGQATVFGAGTLAIGDGASLTLAGALAVSGGLALQGGADPTALVVGAAGLTLASGAPVVLSDSVQNLIEGSGAGTTLTNAGALISGAGTIGSASLTVVNQSGGVIEASGTRALIVGGGKATLLNAGRMEAEGAGGLTLEGAVNNASGTIAAATGSEVTLDGATITGGAVTIAPGGALLAASGTSSVSAATLTDPGKVAIANGAGLILQGAFANTGGVSLEGSGSPTSLIVGGAGLTLSGAGEVSLSDSASNAIVAAAAAALTNVDNTILGAGAVGSASLTLVNQSKGVIDGSGTHILVLATGAHTITNAGLIEATGVGGLVIASAVTNTGALTGAGPGALAIAAAIANDGGTISVAAGGLASLESGQISGGLLAIAATGTLTAASGANVIAVATLTDSGLIAIADGASLTLTGAVGGAGTLAVESAGSATTLTVGAGGLVLNGEGALTLSDSAANVVVGASAAATLDNVNVTIGGAGAIGGGRLTLANGAAGIIDATGASHALVLDTGAGTIGNQGLIEATGAAGLTVASAIWQAATGVLEANGADVRLAGGSVFGGVLEESGGGVFQAVGAGNGLGGVGSSLTNRASVRVGDGATLTLVGSIVNSGAIDLDAVSGTATLGVADSWASLSGGGAIVLGDNPGNVVAAKSAAAKLINVDNTLSGAGQLGDGVLTFVNEAKGIVDANGTHALVLDTGTTAVANAGTLEATGAGGLEILDTTVSGGGVIGANGGQVTLQGATLAGGLLDSSQGAAIVAAGTASVLDGSANRLILDGTVAIGNGVALTLKGEIDDLGEIAVNGGGSATDLVIDSSGASLHGGGLVAVSGSGAEIVGADGGAASLGNGTTITGAGVIFAPSLDLTNAPGGLIENSAAGPLTLTATGAIGNGGLLEGTTGGGLVIGNVTVDQGSGGTILAASGASVVLESAHIEGGAIASAGSGVVSLGDSGVVLDGRAALLTLSAQLVVSDSTTLTVEGAIANAGAIVVNGAGDTTELLVGPAGVALTGAGHVELTDHGNVFITASADATLTNVDNTLSGAGVVGSGPLTLINDSKGVIDATLSVGMLIEAASVTNTGRMEATGGNLTLVGSTIANAGGTIEGAGAAVVLQGADVRGGTLASAGGGGEIATSSGGNVVDGTHSAVANTGQLVVSDNTTLTVEGVIANTGVIALNDTGDGNELLVGPAGVTLSGAGQVTLTDHGNDVFGGAGAIVNVDNTLGGGGIVGVSGETLVNQTMGIIDANVSGGMLIEAASVTNTGRMEATGGNLILVGSTIANAGGTIDGAGAAVVLQGAEVRGGTLATAAGGEIATSSGGNVVDGTSSAVANTGQLVVSDNTTLTVEGVIANTGVIALNDTGDGNELLVGAPGVTLTGAGQVTLTDHGNDFISSTAAANLTNVDNTLSGAGVVGSGPLTLINDSKGVIDAALSVGMLIEAASVTNTGRMEATGGNLTLVGSTIANAGGTIEGAGAAVVLQGADVRGGTLASAGGGEIATSSGGNVVDGTRWAVANTGQLVVSDNTTLTVEGVIANTGVIALNDTGDGNELLVGAPGVTLSGAGRVTLTDHGNDFIAASAAATLTNLGNTIAGYGQFLSGPLTLVNRKGVIEDLGASALTLPVTGATFVNGGGLEAVGSGGIDISNATLDQTMGGEVLAGAGSAVVLRSVIVLGGTLTSRGSGAIVVADSGSTLNGSAAPLANKGILEIENGLTLEARGGITNTGLIELGSSGAVTALFFTADTTLSGGGRIALSDSSANVVLGGAGVTLTNQDNTIFGGGRVGSGRLGLANGTKGVIDASAAVALIIGNGANTIMNAGIIETTGSGGAALASPIDNTGVLRALAGTLTLEGAVSGAGWAVINGGALVARSSFTENVSFTGSTGVLSLSQSQAYEGVVSGFSTKGGTSLDLRDIVFGALTKASFSGGVLTVTDGTHTAKVHLAGTFSSSGFTVSSDGHGGTRVVDPTAPPAAAPRTRFVQAAAQLGPPPLGSSAPGIAAPHADPPALARPA